MRSGILGGDTGRAMAGVAGLGLQAAKGEHEAACRVAPVGAGGDGACHVEGGDDLARRADADLLAQIDANQGVVYQHQSFAQWCAPT
jgi:hypothetical protein